MDKFKRVCIFVIGIMAVMMIIPICIFSISHPANNITGIKVVLSIFGFMVLLVLAFWGVNYIGSKYPKASNIVFYVGIAGYAIALFLVSYFNRCDPGSLVDYGIMHNTAYENAQVPLGQEIYPEYYLKYNNNFFQMLMVEFIFRVTLALKLKDFLVVGLIVNIAQVIGAIFSVRYLGGKTREDRTRIQNYVLLLFVMMLPIMATVQSFYTDSGSFALGIIPVALVKYAANDLKKAWAKYGVAALAGLLVAIAVKVKVTAICIVLALLILSVIRIINLDKRALIAFLISMFAFMVGIELLMSTDSFYLESKKTSDPAISWVALGMKEDGSWDKNRDFAASLYPLKTKEEKQEHSKKYIAENLGTMFSGSHFVAKLRKNYSYGMFGCMDAVYYPLAGYEDNLLWNVFSPWGRYWWRTNILMFGYTFAIWILCLFATVAQLVKVVRKKDCDENMLLAAVALTGIFVFLLFWEANNRQLYNQIPVFLLWMTASANSFAGFKLKKSK